MTNKFSPEEILEDIQPPILLYPDIAVAIGVTNSIIFQQLHLWLKSPISSHEVLLVDGRHWITFTYCQFQEHLPFFAEITIKKSFQHMEKMGLVLSGKKGSLKYYSIDYNVLSQILIDG